MKRLRILILVLGLALLSSCGTPPQIPGVSTPVTVSTNAVVNAEKTLRVSKDTFDLFLRIEHDNQALVQSKFPQIHTFAEYIRKNAPTWLIAANQLKNDYKHGRGDLNALMAALNTLTTNQAKAQTFIQEIK